MATAYRRIMNDGEPAINQHAINGWFISWNPDDQKYHVAIDAPYASSAAVFSEYRNAVQWAKKHPVTSERKQQAGIE